MQKQNAPLQPGPSAAPKRKRTDTSSSSTTTTTTTESMTAGSSKRRCLTQSLCVSADDSNVLSTIDARYDVQLQSVISSARIQQRVTSMLRHLTSPTQSPTTTIATAHTVSITPADPALTIGAKTRVCVLRARATDVGKLVSIAEIAKREIEKELSGQPTREGSAEGRGSAVGRWFQYIVLGEELQQKKRGAGKSADKEDNDDEDGDDGSDFETMKTPFERAIEGQPLVRGVPIMSLFLSRSPVEELKKRYGEQTNAPI